MPRKINHITLSIDEYLQLRRYVQEGNKSARAINRARILLLADQGMTDEEIAETLGVGMATVYRVRKSYNASGLAKALVEKPRRGAPSKIDGRVEATLTMLACSDPPEGYGRGTLHLLAEKLVELQVVDSISLPTVSTVLKKCT
jgi:Transposase and inactivated derivatives